MNLILTIEIRLQIYKMAKISPLFDVLCNSLLMFGVLHEHLSIDESCTLVSSTLGESQLDLAINAVSLLVHVEFPRRLQFMKVRMRVTGRISFLEHALC